MAWGLLFVLQQCRELDDDNCCALISFVLVLLRGDQVMILWTIGMATHDDYEGVWATIQNILLHHERFLKELEIIVVDNKPDSPSGNLVRGYLQNVAARGDVTVKYIPAPEIIGTSAPRDLIFTEATGLWTEVIDCHITLPPGHVDALFNLSKKFPNSSDLFTGPILYDNGGRSSHFDDFWRGEMWGIWSQAWEVPYNVDDGQRGDFVTVFDVGGKCVFKTLEMNPLTLTGSARSKMKFPVDLNYNGHQQILLAAGWKRPLYEPGDMIEIPGQGLGMFACRKAAWAGFNPQFRGFGGEEMYIHEKFRMRGDRCFAVTELLWSHRFGKSKPLTYPLSRWNKVRNYVLGHNELDRDPKPIYDHFVATKLTPEIEWEQLMKEPERPTPPRDKSVSVAVKALPESVEGLYDAVRATPRDLDKHMPKLRELAMMCPHVTEISNRAESLVALAAGSPEVMISYNTEAERPTVIRMQEMASWIKSVTKADSSQVPKIDRCDLLFIDSTHTSQVLSAELEKYAGCVNRFIAIHDTVLYGDRGEDAGPGLLEAMREFCKVNREWFVYYHTGEQHGLTVLGRKPEDKPTTRIVAWPKGSGAGTEMKKMLNSIGIYPTPTCTCTKMAKDMDEWGPEICKTKKPEILAAVRENYDKWGWREKLNIFVASGKAVMTGLAFKLNPLDPIGSLIDEAIRRAEENLEEEVG
jgi:hypothetical protein